MVAVAVVGLAWGCGRQPVPEYPPLARQERQASSEQAPVRLLSVRFEYVFDEQGNWQESFEQSYRVLTHEGVEEWGGTGASWSPWYMARPVLHAQVRDAGGALRQLDPSTITESVEDPNVPDAYGDARLLRAPLPGVQIGSVVTESTLRKTTRPFFAGGSSFEIPFQSEIPRDKVELVVDVPETLPFRYELLDLKVEHTETRKNGRHRLVFRAENLGAVEGIDYYAPGNVVAQPSVAFSTGESWQQIASAYQDLTEKKLKDDAGVAELARRSVQGAESPLERANQLLYALHERVRYVAVEFGQAAIVPATPVEVLKRTYGDCKDQALLLVSMLRAVGLDATLALLDSGPGEDLHPRLPSLDVFTHAIVVVRGEKPFWIDPTSEYARAGELPESDQGRWALIVDDDTRGLTLTPSMTAAQSRYVETRKISLQEQGPALVDEVGAGTGLIEQRLRDSYSGTPDERNKWLTDYVKKFYRADKLVSSKLENQEDFRKPLRLSLVASGAKVADTELFDSNVSVDYRLLTSWLPEPVYDEDRKGDLWLPLRYQAEIRYQVLPPPHFKVKKLPATPDVALGPARIFRQYHTAADGTVEGVFRFEIDKQQLSPAEVKELRTGLEAIGREASDQIEFEHEAQRLIETNQPRRAMQLLRDLTVAEPSAALPQLRYALKLSALGFGEAAREHARTAATLEPGSSLVQGTLGDILQRDLFGRAFSVGFDRQGAVAAFRRAIELSPNDTYAKLSLAILCEYDEQGRRYADAKGVDEALAAYDSIPADELASYDSGTYRFNDLYAVMDSGRFDELRARLAKRKDKDIPAAMNVVATASAGGPAAGIAWVEEQGLRGEARSLALAGAAGIFYRQRRYADSSALFNAAAAGSKESAKYSTLARLLAPATRVEPAQLKQDTPEAVARKAQLLAMVADDSTNQNGPVKALLSSRAQRLDSLSGWMMTSRMLATSSIGGKVPPEVLADTAAAMFKAQVEGTDATGYRVRLSASGIGPDMGGSDFYVVKEGSSYLVRAAGDREALGCEALFQLQKHNEKAARQWMTWAAEGQESAAGDDPLRVAPFVRLWAQGKGNLELATAALCSSSKAGADARALLAKHQNLKGVDTGAIEHALAEAAVIWDDDKEARLRTVDALVARYPDSERAKELQMRVLGRLRRLDAYERAAAKATEGTKGSRFSRSSGLSRLARAQVDNGKLVEARRTYQKLINEDEGWGRAEAYRGAAWTALFIEPRPKDALEQALQAVQLASYDRYEALLALAAIYLDVGNIDEAQRTFQQLLEADKSPEPRDGTRYVLGGLAEAYGMRDVAQRAYSSIAAPSFADDPDSVYRLAQRRLKALAKATR